MRRISFLLIANIVVGVAPVGAASLHAFATSTIGTGDLRSWPEVAGTNLAGLAAADGICEARANGANLANSSDYVAWLSDRDNDAYCRVFGLSGKKADNCGQASLPIGAGPWLRVDDVPFAGTIDEALSANLVYSPLNVDEFGTHFVIGAESFTSTDIDGTFNMAFFDTGDCQYWSTTVDLSGIPSLGSNVSSAQSWTFNGTGNSCDQPHHLMCLEKGFGTPLNGHSQFGHREAFVTSTDVTGDLNGIVGADATCQSLAASANLWQPGSFKALLASSALGLNITDRIQFDGPWFRRDGLLFAHDKAELVNGAVTLPLNVTETGDYLGISVGLTGATASGAPKPDFDCGAWALDPGASQASGALANSIAFEGSGGHNWLDVAELSCSAPPQPGSWSRKLFCVSDSDVIFHDEFRELPLAP